MPGESRATPAGAGKTLGDIPGQMQRRTRYSYLPLAFTRRSKIWSTCMGAKKGGGALYQQRGSNSIHRKSEACASVPEPVAAGCVARITVPT